MKAVKPHCVCISVRHTTQHNTHVIQLRTHLSRPELPRFSVRACSTETPVLSNPLLIAHIIINCQSCSNRQVTVNKYTAMLFSLHVCDQPSQSLDCEKIVPRESLHLRRHGVSGDSSPDR